MKHLTRKAAVVALTGMALTGCAPVDEFLTPTYDSVLEMEGGVPDCQPAYWESPEHCYMDNEHGHSFYVPAGPTAQGPREEIMAGEVIYGYFNKDRIVPEHR